MKIESRSRFPELCGGSVNACTGRWCDSHLLTSSLNKGGANAKSGQIRACEVKHTPRDPQRKCEAQNPGIIALLRRIFSKRKSELKGRVVVNALPESCGHMGYAVLFPVDGPNSAPPFNGDPPLEAYAAAQAEEIVVYKGTIDKNTRRPLFVRKPTIEIPFALDIRRGHYYMGISIVLFRAHEGGLIAQKEDFFVEELMINLSDGSVDVGDLCFTWPDIKLEEMFMYGKFSPHQKPEFYKGDQKLRDMN